MTTEHIVSGPRISHDAAKPLLPVEERLGAIAQHRPAAIQLAEASTDAVARVTPTGFASSVFLAQHPLTAIEVDGLGSSTRQSVEDRAELSLEEIEYIRVGSARARPADRALTEF